MIRMRMRIQYDGLSYCGWQRQPNARSIQATIEDALKVLYCHKITIHASGRTDSGVHAIGQIAHFDLPKDLIHKIPSEKLLFSLNGLLDKDIRITAIEPCSIAFHARFSAKAKCYRYHISNKRFINPLYRHLYVHIKYSLSKALILKSCEKLQGVHDFKALANENEKGSAAKNSIRNLYSLNAIETDEGWIFEFIGNGFLYKMVRNCMGLILQVSSGQIPLESIDTTLLSSKRPEKLPCAPAHGLILQDVFYPTEIDDADQSPLTSEVVSFFEPQARVKNS